MNKFERFGIVLGVFYLIGISTLFLASFIPLWTQMVFVPFTSLVVILFFWRYQQGKQFRMPQFGEWSGKQALSLSILLFLITLTIRFPSVLLYGIPLEKTVLFLLAYLMIIVVEGWSPQFFGFTLVNWKRQLLLSFALFCISLFVFGTSLWMGVLFLGWRFHFYPLTFFSSLPFMLTVGLGEEALFRGYMQTKVKTIGRKKAIFLVSFLLFGLWHVVWHVTPLHLGALIFRVLMTGAIGVMFGIVYDHTESLLGIIIAHGVWDAWATSSRVSGVSGTTSFTLLTGILMIVFYALFLPFIGRISEKIGDRAYSG